MSNVHSTSTSTTGTNTVTKAAGPNVTWNLTYLSVSMSGVSFGASGKVKVYDGSVAAANLIFSAHLVGPVGSVGTLQEIPLPVDARGLPTLQGSPGNAMNIVVDGTGTCETIINARFTDGLP